MPLSERQLELVRDSFRALRDDPEPKSIEFYNALFHHAPHLRDLFREDLAGQGMRFMATLGAIVDNLHNPDAMKNRYTDLGKGHRAMGVKAEDFEPMGLALIDTLASTLGDRFSDEAREAWQTAYSEFSRKIVERGEIPEKAGE